MLKVLIDTSVVIDHLRGISSVFRTLEIKRQKDQVRLLLPHIVIIELFAGKELQGKRAKNKIEELLDGLEVVGLTVHSAKRAGELIRKYPQIPDPFDFVIAAIALEEDALIATANPKHFRQIPGVSLYDDRKN